MTRPAPSKTTRAWSDQARTCIECDSPFALAESEIEFFAMRGLELPRRCAACRKSRREARAALTY
ncbi:MAG: zinc-ribbon domain containing protein [Vicinamibacterales bacterium]